MIWWCSVKVKPCFNLLTKTKDASKIQNFGKKYTNVIFSMVLKDSQEHVILIFS